MSKHDDPTVLLVENDPAAMDVLIDGIKQQGWKLEVAATGASALQWAEKYRPDLVLAEAHLPDMEDLGILQGLSDVGCADVPVILLSKIQGPEMRVAGLRAGAMDFIHKPFFPEEVVCRVGNWLRVSRRLRQAETASAATAESVAS